MYFVCEIVFLKTDIVLAPALYHLIDSTFRTAEALWGAST